MTASRVALLVPLLLVTFASAFAFTPNRPTNLLSQQAVASPQASSLAMQQRSTAPRMAATRASLEASATPPSSGVGVAPSIVNLAKNIVGSGVLALAAGIAAFSGSPLALLPAILILFFTGALSAYTFSTIARVGAGVGANTYKETWAKVFGEKTSFIPEVTVVFMTAAAGLSYSIIIGETFSGIAKLAGLTGALATPNAWIVILSTFVLLPLALLRDLSSLAVGSVIGTAGTCYTALFIFKRLLDKSYAAGGKFFTEIPAAVRPAFAAPTAARPLLNSGMFVLLSMLSSAFLAHYNAPKFYDELEAPPDGKSKLGRFNLVVGAAFGAAALLMGSIMAGGYLTFGSAAQGLILNNYATSDPLAFVARLGIGMSIIFSYPLNFVGLRGGVLGMLGLADKADDNKVHVVATVALLCLMNGASLILKDLGLVVALGGAILASALVYILPALMAIGEKAGVMSKGEKLLNWGLTGLGLFFAVLGSILSLK